MSEHSDQEDGTEDGVSGDAIYGETGTEPPDLDASSPGDTGSDGESTRQASKSVGSESNQSASDGYRNSSQSHNRITPPDDPEQTATGDRGQTDHQSPAGGERADLTETGSRSSGLPEVDGFTWTDEGTTVFTEAPEGDYTPPDGESNARYLNRRQRPLTEGLPPVTTHLRPELNQALSFAQLDAERFFTKRGSRQEIKQMDFYEAALTVALWHQKEVFALLAEFGYGE